MGYVLMQMRMIVNTICTQNCGMGDLMSEYFRLPEFRCALAAWQLGDLDLFGRNLDEVAVTYDS